MKSLNNEELYQRVEAVCWQASVSVPQMASAIGKEYRTFKGYLCKQRQHNLWPLLPLILDAYPRISRHWLYFGEGPIFIGRGIPEGLPVPPLEILRVGEAMAADCGGSWGQVLRMIVDNAREELEQQGSAPQTSQELAKAKDEALRLHRMMEGLQGEIINLQKELLAMHKAEKAERTEAKECAGRAASTGHTAARS